MDELVAWVVFPLVALAICTGIGLLAERLAGARLEGALLPALGFAVGIVALGPLFALGAGELAGLVLLAVMAAAGFAVALERRRPGWGALAGLATYALHISPVALSGGATFLGYNLLNDTAIHLALVDWIGDHGSRYSQLAPSSYAAAIDEYVGSSYPMGSHELLAALRPISGLDPALIYQPFLALAAGLAAAAVYGLLRSEGARPPVAAGAAFAALGGQLVFSFALQGGIKEITFITCLATAAAVGAQLTRTERPAGVAALTAVAAAALYAIYGVYAMPWIGTLALLALVLLHRATRPLARPSLVGAGAFFLAIAVGLKGSIDYYRHGHDVITAGGELGPLAGPLKLLQVGGIWLNGDYRFEPTHAWLTYLLAGAVVALALAGLLLAVRRRTAGALMLALPALVALLVVAPLSSPYIDAKLLVVLSPAVAVAACLGMGALPRRVWMVAAVVLGGALLVSDGLAYRMALLAPMDRLDELARIDARFAARGPVLVNEFEEYTKHFMRRSPGSDPYERWNAGRAQLLDPTLPIGGHAYDLDQLEPAFVQRYELIAIRRSPAGSRPASNYERVFRGHWYDVWRQAGAAPARHIPLGAPPLQAAAELPCGQIRRLADQGPLAAAVRPRPTVVDLTKASLPPGWYREAKSETQIEIRKGGSITTRAEGAITGLGPSGGRLRAWLRGRSYRAGRLVVDGKPLALPRESNGPNQWIDAGTVTIASDAAPPVRLERPKRSLRPGDARPDHVGPVELVPDVDPRIVRVRPTDYRKLCGAQLDWIDVLRG